MTSRQVDGVFRQAILLTVIMLLGWVAAFWPARVWAGGDGIRWMSFAAGTCLISGWMAVGVPRLSLFPNDLAVMLAQTMTRLALVSIVAVVIKKMFPQVGFRQFYGWLIGFYLLALAAEVGLLLKTPGGRPIESSRQQHERR